MSILTTKSDESTIASNNLIKASLFPSSVHCSYYATVQLMLHLLRTHFGKTELEIKNEGIEGGRMEKGFHKWLQNLIFVEFARLDNGGTDAAKFNSKIRLLSAARGKADYENQPIMRQEALKAYEMSVHTKALLEKHFQL